MFKRRFADGKEPGRGFAVLRLVIWIVGILIVLPAAALVVLHLPPVQRALIVRAAETMEQDTGLRLEMQSFVWWPFSSLSIRNVQVSAPGRKIVECEELRLSYRVSPQSPYVEPKEAFFVKPFIHLERDATGRWLVPGSWKGGRMAAWGGFPHSLANLPLPRVRVSSGTIDAEQEGRSILTIKDVTGPLPIRLVSGPEGPKLRMDLGQWGR